MQSGIPEAVIATGASGCGNEGERGSAGGGFGKGEGGGRDEGCGRWKERVCELGVGGKGKGDAEERCRSRSSGQSSTREYKLFWDRFTKLHVASSLLPRGRESRPLSQVATAPEPLPDVEFYFRAKDAGIDGAHFELDTKVGATSWLLPDFGWSLSSVSYMRLVIGMRRILQLAGTASRWVRPPRRGSSPEPISRDRKSVV